MEEEKFWVTLGTLAGSPGLVVMGDGSCLKVVGSNPTTVCWMNLFPHLLVVKIISLKRRK